MIMILKRETEVLKQVSTRTTVLDSKLVKA